MLSQFSRSFAEVSQPIESLAVDFCTDASFAKLWDLWHGLWFQCLINLCQHYSDTRPWRSINFFNTFAFNYSTLFKDSWWLYSETSFLWMKNLRLVSQAFSLPKHKPKWHLYSTMAVIAADSSQNSGGKNGHMLLCSVIPKTMWWVPGTSFHSWRPYVNPVFLIWYRELMKYMNVNAWNIWKPTSRLCCQRQCGLFPGLQHFTQFTESCVFLPVSSPTTSSQFLTYPPPYQVLSLIE